MKKYILPLMFAATLAATNKAHQEEIDALHAHYFKKVHEAYIIGQIHFLEDYSVIDWVKHGEETDGPPVWFDKSRLDQELFPFHSDAVDLDFSDIYEKSFYSLFE